MSDTVDSAALPAPLLIRNPPGPRFQIKEVAAATRVPYTRAKRFMQLGLVHRVTPPGSATGPALYGVTDLGVTAVLSALVDLDLEGDMLTAASRALYAWHAKDNPKPPHLPKGMLPIGAAMLGASQGAWWALRVTLVRGDQSGRVQRLGAVYDTNGPPPPPADDLAAEMMPVGSVMLHLPQLLLPLLRFAAPPRGH